ncbi:EAL domain-containing protein [Pseudodesulfovibrio thermohalotolerans]|uniref:EAL domain-containing protein n=1 Tax=Pseudodesulfovibrio thermohalotolerans TaxID=2880651 RepID=UPI002441D36A|nr:EAL domain-containing protein [Pseudodesulfovibrio thermohalotolerans]WFS63494.1 EAL domain-containing protein [Pseudodesulfovibrio thermohalotolerans]
MPDILEIIENRFLVTHFQPQVSLKRKAVVGLEALSRGFDPQSGDIIPPTLLFEQARDRASRLALDRACRTSAAESFAALLRRDKGLMLSMNIDASCINEETRGSCHLLNLVTRCGISPGNVIIEIIESRCEDIDALMAFVRFYRERGFLIALDDVGAGFSNLDRIPLLKPDVIKLDRTLVSAVDQQFHKLEVVRSFVQMSNRLGCLVLAEGVETAEEAMCLLSNGVDVFQGFYFARPAPGLDAVPGMASKVDALAERHREKRTQQIADAKRLYSSYDLTVLTMCQSLAETPAKGMASALSGFVETYDTVECLYVLDMRGNQISDTVCDQGRLKTCKRFLYEPAMAGADHSLKEYFLPIQAGLEKFTTRPYISLASGNLCITISHVFYHKSSGRHRILCVDMSREEESACGR